MAGGGEECSYPILQAQNKDALTHFWYLICPLMSHPVMSGFYLFPAPEFSWEQSGDWVKGEMKETWFPLSRIPLFAVAWEEEEGAIVI